MDKAALRSEVRKRRRALRAVEAASRSVQLCARIAALPEWQEADAVLSYVPAKENEADVMPVLRDRLGHCGGVYVPVTGPGNRLRWSRLEAWEELGPGHFDIPEPRKEYLRVEPPPSGSICLVPGLAFSPDGARIGFGRGYFDRFLADFDGTSVGVAYDFQMYPELPVETHDVRLDIVVSESAVYRG
jgi:5-formyltetrahydrofolate cyclo-ligase